MNARGGAHEPHNSQHEQRRDVAVSSMRRDVPFHIMYYIMCTFSCISILGSVRAHYCFTCIALPMCRVGREVGGSLRRTLGSTTRPGRDPSGPGDGVGNGPGAWQAVLVAWVRLLDACAPLLSL